MKKLVLIFLLICETSVGSQEILKAEKELLGFVDVGKSQAAISYSTDDEGFHSPGSPYINMAGHLVFIPNMQGKQYIEFDNQFLFKNAAIDLSDVWVGNTPLVSQQGISIASSNQYLFNGLDIVFIDYHEKRSYFDWDTNYPAPFGAILYSEKNKNGIAIVFDINHPSKEFSIVDQSRLKTWLPTQPGGFTIGDDGLLYRNGMLWSAVKPLGKEDLGLRYIGRLMSGHAIWSSGADANMFFIVDSRGHEELSVEIPIYSPFNWGLGPWGELYYLHAPPMDKRMDPIYSAYSPELGVPAKLVVYRNHLKYFGRLFANRVRLRREPNTTSDVIGTYPMKTGFRIVETGTKKETIGDKTDVWYKVRLLDGTEGWFFGAFVANLYDGPGTPPPWPNVADW